MLVVKRFVCVAVQPTMAGSDAQTLVTVSSNSSQEPTISNRVRSVKSKRLSTKDAITSPAKSAIMSGAGCAMVHTRRPWADITTAFLCVQESNSETLHTVDCFGD